MSIRFESTQKSFVAFNINTESEFWWRVQAPSRNGRRGYLADRLNWAFCSSGFVCRQDIFKTEMWNEHTAAHPKCQYHLLTKNSRHLFSRRAPQQPTKPRRKSKDPIPSTAKTVFESTGCCINISLNTAVPNNTNNPTPRRKHPAIWQRDIRVGAVEGARKMVHYKFMETLDKMQTDVGSAEENTNGWYIWASGLSFWHSHSPVPEKLLIRSNVISFRAMLWWDR